MAQKIDRWLTVTPRLSLAEIGDLAAELAQNLDLSLPVRAAIVASDPAELTHHLETLKTHLQGSVGTIDHNDIFLEIAPKNPKIGFLFSGQAAPVYADGGAWSRRFATIQTLYEEAELPAGDRGTQPAIITASMAGLTLLDTLGITADIAVGHSLGELCALSWAGGYDRATLIALATVRGQIMAELETPAGSMASIGAGVGEVQALCNGHRVTIAGLNSPAQTVISGDLGAVFDVVQKATQKGLRAIPLPVSHAFHSPFMAAVIEPLGAYLRGIAPQSLEKTVISTVTGTRLAPDTNLRSLLCQ